MKQYLFSYCTFHLRVTHSVTIRIRKRILKKRKVERLDIRHDEGEGCEYLSRGRILVENHRENKWENV